MDYRKMRAKQAPINIGGLQWRGFQVPWCQPTNYHGPTTTQDSREEGMTTPFPPQEI